MKNGQKIEKMAKPRQAMVILALLKMRKRSAVILIKTKAISFGKRTVNQITINRIIGKTEPIGIISILVKHLIHVFIHPQATVETTVKAITKVTIIISLRPTVKTPIKTKIEKTRKTAVKIPIKTLLTFKTTTSNILTPRVPIIPHTTEQTKVATNTTTMASIIINDTLIRQTITIISLVTIVKTLTVSSILHKM